MRQARLPERRSSPATSIKAIGSVCTLSSEEACMESAHREKRQQHFGHRKLLVKPQLVFSTPQSRQSTLTQLDFISTPRGSADVIQSDDDDAYEEDRPRKRARKHSTRQPKTNTLTQIGFVDPSGEVAAEWQNRYVRDSYSDSEEIRLSAVEVPSEDVQVPDTPPHGRALDIQTEEIVHASQPSNTESNRSWTTALQYSTPMANRRLEAPSSQTPSSIALSTSHRSRKSPEQQRSPLHNRSVNARISPDKTREIKQIVIPSSPIIARDFAVTQAADADTLEALNSRKRNPLAYIDAMDAEDEEESQDVVFRRSGSDDSEDQLTYDPALSALDRDAARFALTQFGVAPTAKVRETQLFVSSSPQDGYGLPGDDNDEAEAVVKVDELVPQVMSVPDSQPITPIKNNSALPPSQVSTISPTQNAKRSAALDAPASSAIAINSLSSNQSSLPRPPWTESEQGEWATREQAALARIDTLSSEYSLPAPPAFDDDT